jgi:hypothetical protein
VLEQQLSVEVVVVGAAKCVYFIPPQTQLFQTLPQTVEPEGLEITVELQEQLERQGLLFLNP